MFGMPLLTTIATSTCNWYLWTFFHRTTSFMAL